MISAVKWMYHGRGTNNFRSGLESGSVQSRMNVFVLCWNNSRTGLESFWIIRDAFESNKSSSRRESKILFWTNVIHSHLYCIRSKKTYWKTSITSIVLTSLFTEWIIRSIGSCRSVGSESWSNITMQIIRLELILYPVYWKRC